MKHDSIIFDLDGTLWDSTEGICETWNQVLAGYPEVNQVITAENLHGCMGLQMRDIAEKLFPGHSHSLQNELMEKCCELENEYLAEHGGILYPDLKSVLEILSGKYKLFVVSNCQKGYIESFFAAHDTSKYFTDIECYGNTDLSKGENNKLVIERNNLKKLSEQSHENTNKS